MNKSAAKHAIEILDQLELIGFPNRGNIAKIEEYVKQLQKLGSELTDPAHKISIERIANSVQKIKKRLEVDNDIPTPLYTTYNSQLIVFKENLISS